MRVLVENSLAPLEALNRGLTALEAKRHSVIAWQPYRITDEQLRSDSEALNDTVLKFFQHLIAVMGMPIKEWAAKFKEIEDRIVELSRSIHGRLDTLAW